MKDKIKIKKRDKEKAELIYLKYKEASIMYLVAQNFEWIVECECEKCRLGEADCDACETKKEFRENYTYNCKNSCFDRMDDTLI